VIGACPVTRLTKRWPSKDGFPRTNRDFHKAGSKLKRTFAGLPKLAHDFFVSAKAKTNAELVFPPLLRNTVGKQLAVLEDGVAPVLVSYELQTFCFIGFGR
jgi:hypothetical protein